VDGDTPLDTLSAYRVSFMRTIFLRRVVSVPLCTHNSPRRHHLHARQRHRKRILFSTATQQLTRSFRTGKGLVIGCLFSLFGNFNAMITPRRVRRWVEVAAYERGMTPEGSHEGKTLAIFRVCALCACSVIHGSHGPHGQQLRSLALFR